MSYNNEGPSVTKIIIILIAIFLGIPLTAWGISVLFSDIHGRGEQQKEINGATNRTFQYEHFFVLDGTIRSQAQSAKEAQKEVEKFNSSTPPSAQEAFNITETRNQKEANLTGLLQICRSNIQEYNNNAQQFTREKFLSTKLPPSFNPAACENPNLLPPSAGGQ